MYTRSPVDLHLVSDITLTPRQEASRAQNTVFQLLLSQCQIRFAQHVRCLLMMSSDTAPLSSPLLHSQKRRVWWAGCQRQDTKSSLHCAIHKNGLSGWLIGVCCHNQETISNLLNNTTIASLILQLDKKH